MGVDLAPAIEDHAEGDIGDDAEADPDDPLKTLQQSGDQRRCRAHQGDRESEPGDQQPEVKRAVPATARTLSTDIETSATTISSRALRMLLRLPAAEPDTAAARPAKAAAACLSPRISRSIFHATQSSRRPPARVSPMMARNFDAMTAKTMRSRVAMTIPIRIARRRSSGANPAAAMPTTMALSPARVMSMTTTWMKALNWEKSITGTSSGDTNGDLGRPAAAQIWAAKPGRQPPERRSAGQPSHAGCAAAANAP